MNKKHLALGAGMEMAEAITNPKSNEEKIDILERQLASMVTAFQIAKRHINDKEKGSQSRRSQENLNRKGIPIGSCFFGSTRGVLYMLTVVKGGYIVGTSKYNSLSQAAEAVSGVRRSGWAFWKTIDGKTLKEVYGK